VARAQTEVIVAKTGDGSPDGVGTFAGSFGFGRPSLNDLGEAAFGAKLTGVGVTATNDWGNFLGAGGPLAAISREGDPSPDGNGIIHAIGNPHINDNGTIAFWTGINGSSPSSTQGFFTGSGGALTKIARLGESAGGNGTYSSLFSGSLLLNDAGQVGFSSPLTGTDAGAANDFAIFRGSGGAATEIVREGDTVPGGGTFQFLANASMNESGQIAFESGVAGSGSTRGLFVGSGGAITEIARHGDSAPGSGLGTFTTTLGTPIINDLAQVAFSATLTGTTLGSSNDRGLFRGSGGAITPIVREGEGTPTAGVNFFNMGTSTYGMNNSGELLFSSSVSGTGVGSSNDQALFRSDGATTVQIAREGDAVPSGFGSFGSFSDMAINDSGQVLFKSGSTGLYFYDDTLGLLEVVRNGQPLFGSTLQNFSYFTSNYQGDERDGFNEAGQVAYHFTLQNGVEGVAVWSSPGSTPDTPVLPTGGGGGGRFEFDDVSGDGNWFDPPTVSGYQYATTDTSNSTEVGLPPIANVPDGDGEYLVSSVHGDQIVLAGANYVFPSPVDFFTITGINPLVDGEDPLAFPTYLDFDVATVSFTMTPIPEPSTLVLAGLCLLNLLGCRRFRRRTV